MHFLTLTAFFFGAVAFAAPAEEKQDACCCCNISKPAIVCREDMGEGCFCPKVLCPADAPTIWADTAKPTEVPDEEQDDENGSHKCCCCNPKTQAIECSWKQSPEDCICLAIACPTGAPTVWPEGTTQTPTATATSVPPNQKPCCCCNIGKGAIVCTVREEGEDDSCVCPLILCPSGAPTLTEYPAPKETGDDGGCEGDD